MQNYNSKYKSDLKDRCFKFSLATISLTDSLPNKRAAWTIADQLLSAAMSVGANLTEGGASSSRLEYKKYYEIALKSANETRYWLQLLKGSGLSSERDVEPLLSEVDEVAKMLAVGVMRLKGKL